MTKQFWICFPKGYYVIRQGWLTVLLCDGMHMDEVWVSGGCLFGQCWPSLYSWTELQLGLDATSQPWAFITSYNLVVGFHGGRKMWLRNGVVVVVMSQGLCKVKWVSKRKQRKGEVGEKRLRGRRELLPGGRLSSLCLPWDSSAALNMPVIFNQRRNRAQRRPPLLQYFLSVRRGNGGEPHFLVTWRSGSWIRFREGGRWGRVNEGRRGSWAGCLIPTPAHIFTQHLLSPTFNPLSWPDEAVCFN